MTCVIALLDSALCMLIAKIHRISLHEKVPSINLALRMQYMWYEKQLTR